MSLCFQKGKLWGNVVFTATTINMCICFTYTYRQIIFTLNWGDFAPWRQKHHLWFLKCFPLLVPCLLWLIIRIFLALLQTNHSKVLMQWNYDKYCVVNGSWFTGVDFVANRWVSTAWVSLDLAGFGLSIF